MSEAKVKLVDGQYGVQQTSAIVDVLAAAVNAGEKVLAAMRNATGFLAKAKAIAGIVSILMQYADDLMKLASVDFGRFLAEVQEYDDAERTQLRDRFYVKLDLENNHLELLLEAIFATLLDGQDFVQGVIDLFKPKPVNPIQAVA